MEAWYGHNLLLPQGNLAQETFLKRSFYPRVNKSLYFSSTLRSLVAYSFDMTNPQEPQNQQPQNQPQDQNAYAQPAQPAQGEEKKDSSGKSLFGKIAVAVLIAAAVLGFRYHDADWMPFNNNAQAGDCLSADVEKDDSSKPKAVDCGDAEAKYEVVEKDSQDNLPNCDAVADANVELTYTQGSKVTTYCLKQK